jgi:hypothetical protein
MDGRMMLEWILGRWGGGCCGLDASGSKWESVVAFCGRGSESLGFMGDGEFLD